MVEKFTIEEIKNYVLSQDSMGDIAYNLSAENIRKANEPKETSEEVVRKVKFPATEEMHCPDCNHPTPHTLHPDTRLSFVPKSYDERLYKWTCDICKHQL